MVHQSAHLRAPALAFTPRRGIGRLAVPNRNEGNMPPKRKKRAAAKSAEPAMEQFNVGVWPEMAERILRAGRARGMGGAAFIRLMIHENIDKYDPPAGGKS
jgi:hypothetical protein